MKYPVNRKARSSWILADPSMLDLTQGQLARFYDKMSGIYHHSELSINHTELGFTHNAIGHLWGGKSEGSSQQTETDNREKKFPSSFILSCSQYQRSKIVKAKSKKINVTAGSEKFTPDKKQSNNVGIEKQNYDTEKVINDLDSKLRLSEKVSISRRHEPARKISSREMEAGISAEVPRNFLRELKAEIGNSWHIFTGETTAHGYKRTVASHRSKPGRLVTAHFMQHSFYFILSNGTEPGLEVSSPHAAALFAPSSSFSNLHLILKKKIPYIRYSSSHPTIDFNSVNNSLQIIRKKP